MSLTGLLADFNAERTRQLKANNVIKQQIEELEKLLNVGQEPWWYGILLERIASEMNKDPRLENYHDGKILGPFGLSSETAIHFHKKDVPQKELFNVKGGVLSVTFRPGSYEEDNFELRRVDYSKHKDLYRKGTIGDWNGFNYETVPLPETITELVDIMLRRLEE